MAYIKFKDLAFKPLTPNLYNIKRLKAIFKNTSYCPLYKENRIRGYINTNVLKTTIRLLNISLKDLFYPIGRSPALL